MTRNRSRLALVLAALVVVSLEYLVPFGRYVLYPFTLLATWVHEMGHGLTALAMGGEFVRLEIFADASGLAVTAVRDGLPAALVSAGGLLAPPLVCALALALVRGPGRAAAFLTAMAALLVLSLVLWVRSLTGVLAVLGLAAVFAAGVRFGTGWVRVVLAQLVAVVLGLDAVTRTLGYLFVARVQAGTTAGGRSDVGGMADALGGPYWLWGALVGAVALALLGLGLWAAAQPDRGAGPPDGLVPGRSPDRARGLAGRR